jgi:hypothetical protein
MRRNPFLGDPPNWYGGVRPASPTNWAGPQAGPGDTSNYRAATMISSNAPAPSNAPSNAPSSTSQAADNPKVIFVAPQPRSPAHPLQLNSAAGLQYPAAGGTTVLLTYALPSGQTLEIDAIAIVNIGPNLVDYQGWVIYRVLRNGAGVRGFENLVAQVGTLAQPAPITQPLVFQGGETLQVTASVPNGQAAPGGNAPAVRLLGSLKLAQPKPNLLPRG